MSNTPSRSLHIGLWVAQGLLAAAFLMSGSFKVMTPGEELVAAGMTVPTLALRVAGASEVLGALGLLLPSALRIQPRLTPIAASALALGSADALLISYAEHNGFYTAAFKNLFDWMSRIEMKVFQGKRTLAMATSIGRRGGANVLKTALDSAPHFGAEIISSLTVPRFRDTFDRERGELKDPTLAAELGRALDRFARRLDPEARLSAAQATPGSALWNERYAEPFASYGVEANDFLRAVAGRIPAGPVLVIAEGEGRNAVFLAERGHAVTAMDLSSVGLDNAKILAARRNVDLTTVVADLADFEFGESRWAAIVSIWAHVPPELRRTVHAACVRALRPGGVLILEAYAPAQLDRPGVGGPPSREMLVDPDTARRELDGLHFELCQQAERIVGEGRYHNGSSATTQILAVRRST